MPQTAVRPIDSRYRPPVAGIDLVQSLNYLALDEIGEEFAYDRYTGARLPYVAGSRPQLEAIVAAVVPAGSTPRQAVGAIAKYVAEKVLWAGFYEQAKGHRLPGDRAMTEEAIAASGYGWCNEQARLFCALTQIAGVPSRLVFAANLDAHYGHVVNEVLLPDGWMMVDESFGYCFERDGQPVQASRVYRDPANHAYFSPIYRQMCYDLDAKLGKGICGRDFRMAVAKDPLDGFRDLGYHNHFVV